MQATLLRTLTEKSELKFGKFSNYTVGRLIELKKMPYLWWVYFNSSAVSFASSVLDKIGISQEYRIAKPGKSPGKEDEVFQSVMGYKQQRITEGNPGNGSGRTKLMRKQFKELKRISLNNSKRCLSKGLLQSKNHPHGPQIKPSRQQTRRR